MSDDNGDWPGTTKCPRCGGIAWPVEPAGWLCVSCNERIEKRTQPRRPLDRLIDEACRSFGRFASDPELSFSWYDAALLSQRVRRGK